MLSEDKFISIFCFVDDLLKEINHQEDCRRRVLKQGGILVGVNIDFPFDDEVNQAMAN